MTDASTGIDGRRMELLLAEYSALRDVIERKQSNQLRLTSLNLTIVATVAGLVLSQKSQPALILVLPITCSALGFSVLSQAHDQKIAAAYISERIRPVALEYTSDNRLFDWEDYFNKHKDFGYLLQASALAVLFPGTSIAGLAIGSFTIFSPSTLGAWLLGLLVNVLFGTAAWYSYRGRVNHFWERLRPLITQLPKVVRARRGR